MKRPNPSEYTHRELASGPIVWFGIIVTTCLLLVVFQTMLWLVLPVMLAIIANYILSPVVDMAMARGMNRPRAVFLVTILLCVFLLALGVIVQPKVSMLVSSGPGKLQEYAKTGENLFEKAKASALKTFPFLHTKEAHVQSPDADMPEAPSGPSPDTTKAEDATTPLAAPGGTIAPAKAATPESPATQDELSTWGASHSEDIAMVAVRWIPSLLLVPYMTYFFLLDGPRFKRFLVRAIPNAFFEKALFLFFRVDEQLRRYFQGLMALTALDATCLGIGLWFLGLNSPFFWAIVAAVMAWLPYLGSVGGGLLVVLVAAHDAPANHALPYQVVGLFVVVRLLDDFVFMPLTVGRSLEMHPLITVLMILLGGAVAGVAGLLLVMPVFGVIMVSGQIIGELVADARIRARHRHAQELRRIRAEAGL